MQDWDIKIIVLGYDGSEGSDKALRLASTLARKTNARTIVVSVFDKLHVYNAVDGPREARVVGRAQDVAGEAVLKLQAAGVDAEPDAAEGSAGEALLAAADARQADLIVVGRRGHGLLAGLLLGSTSEYVVRRAKVPVLVAE